MPSILHLSDLHFTDNRDVFRFIDIEPQEFASRIVEPLANRPDYVVISGDFTWDGDISDFELARQFVECLLARLNLPPDRLAISPGNHDIRWGRGEHPANETERRSPYRVFYRQLKNRDPIDDLNDFIVRPDLTLLCLNSTSKESREFAGYGFIGERQHRSLWKAVQLEPLFTPAAIRVAVLHHHLLPVTWREPISPDAKYSLTLDAEAIQIQLLNAGFQMALHGHQHQPFLRAISDPTRSDNACLLIAGCGSTGLVRAKLGSVGRNHFQMVSIRRHKAHIEWYESDFRDVGSFRLSKEWDYQFRPDPITPLFIGVSGMSGRARSTFCQDLHNRLHRRYGDSVKIDLVPSFAGELIKEGRSHDQLTRPDDYAAYLRRHFANLNRTDADVIILDRTLLDTLAFAELNGNLASDWLDLTQVIAETTAQKMFAYFFVPYAPADTDNSGERQYRERLDTSLWTVVNRYIKRPLMGDPANIERADKIMFSKLQEVL